MIEWKKYDPNNPPKEGKYLVTDKVDIDLWDCEVDIFDNLIWTELEKRESKSPVIYVSHYAEINLPEGDS